MKHFQIPYSNFAILAIGAQHALMGSEYRKFAHCAGRVLRQFQCLLMKYAYLSRMKKGELLLDLPEDFHFDNLKPHYLKLQWLLVEDVNCPVHDCQQYKMRPTYTATKILDGICGRRLSYVLTTNQMRFLAIYNGCNHLREFEQVFWRCLLPRSCRQVNCHFQ